MTLDVQVERFGPDAARALARLIGAAQGDDPLTRVSVVVPSGPVGLATRRLLASGRLGVRRPGIVNVRFLTMAGLAEELGGTRVTSGGRRPATGAVLHAAARSALGSDPGPLFGPVKDHPATLSALAATYRELCHESPTTLESLAGAGERAAEVVRLIGRIKRNLAGWYDEVDVAEAACAEVPVSSMVEVGPVIVYLPLAMVPAQEALVRAISLCNPVTVVLGSTGDPLGDEPAADLANRLGGGWSPALGAPTGQLVVSAPSADAEVLLAVRGVMDEHRQGTPLERIALVDGGNEPYPRLIREVLEQSKIPFNGRGIRPLSSTLAGRILTGALSLVDEGWRRDEVVAWMASVPLVSRGRPIPVTAWDLLSAGAGVTAGLESWRDHLRPLGDAAGLLEFIEQLAGRLANQPGTWSGWSDWSRELLQTLSGGPLRTAEWGAEEAAACTAVEEVLTGLSVLDEVDPSPGFAAFRSALCCELEASAPQTSRFGRGLLVGRIGDLVGLDLDIIFVVGMTDGAFPGRTGDDPLVPDRERAVHRDVPLRAAWASQSRRDYLAALASAEVRVLSYARGDQRGGREQRPSRWLLDTLSELVGGGRRLYHGDLDGLDPDPAFVTVSSYTAAVARAGEPMSLEDRDLRSLLRWTTDGRPVDRHYLVEIDPVLRRGLDTQQGRGSSSFTRFDGRVDHHVDGQDQSVTRLETYAACPRRYFFESVLRVGVRERPEEIMTVSAADRGTMVHRILEQFLGEQIALPRDKRIQPTTPWGPADVDRLLSVADLVFTDYAQQGLTGRTLFWQVQKAAVTRDLERFLVEDTRYRKQKGAVPEAVEYRFGSGGRPAVTVPLGGDRVVSFRGSVDRVDRLTAASSDGPVYVVIDYKTGGFYGMLDDDPVARGTKLQLPIYGLAMRQQMEAAGVEVRYWFVSERANFAEYGYELTAAHGERVQEVLRVLVAGIEEGRFPARPAQGSCGICPFDEICPADRLPSWERKRRDPLLAEYAGLVEPDGAK